MDFEISGETIIICENIYKKRLLNKFNDMKEMYPIHFITMQEFIKKCTYDYDYKAIVYLMEKYSYKYEVAKMYIDNTYYIENKQYKSEKLEKLRAIKNELEKNNLLIYDEYTMIIFLNMQTRELHLIIDRKTFKTNERGRMGNDKEKTND